jgi:hypothetical protein
MSASEFNKKVKNIRDEFMQRTKVKIGQPVVKNGKLTLNFKQERLMDLDNPRNTTIKQAMNNLVTQSDVKFQGIDQKLMFSNNTNETINILKNAKPEDVKKSKYLKGMMQMKGKIGTAAKLIAAGAGTAAAFSTVATADTGEVQPKPKKMDLDVNFLSDYKPGVKDYATAGYGATLASKYTKLDPLKKFRRFLTAAPVRKGIGHLLRPLGTMAGAIGMWPGAAYLSNKFAEPGEPPVKAFDYTNPMDRVGAAGELGLSKQLVGGSQQLARKFKNPLVRRTIQRAANLGLSPKWAMRAARVGSPIGWASLGLEGVYQYGKWAKGEIERVKNMTPEEREQYNAEQQEQMGMAAADGGLANLTRTVAPPRGPQHMGLASFKKHGR